MSRRRRERPKTSFKADAYILEITDHELIYGLMALPPNAEEGAFAEGLTIEMDCLVHEPIERAGQTMHCRIVANRPLVEIVTLEERAPFTGVGAIIRNNGENEFVLTVPYDAVLSLYGLMQSGAIKHIEMQATAIERGAAAVLSYDFSRNRRIAAERATALVRAKAMVEQPLGGRQ